ncbi:transposase [Janthinobacterium fluminis]|uniref:Transposase n=1 Tax=Janthinobacterium fluminis TaxID=2987524 RepID=A0ABT5K400_9BURK|nr:transposase [Janthinobacterium fluminis]MDC8758457.1 transposase [Janthinobacterium fluminis]
MSRPLRIEYPGAIYHVTSRGNDHAPVFLVDGDRHQFCRLLEECVDRFGWICHAYCLMGNHYHLMLETPAANLSAGMRHLNGNYTQWFNWRHERVGHVFQGRFKSILVDRDSYLLELCRYIVLNPVRALMVPAAADYPWSSYRATSGAAHVPHWLRVRWLLSQFDDDAGLAARKYAAFVAQGLGEASPWFALKGQVLLGADAFVAAMRPRIEEKCVPPDISAAQRFAFRPGLAAILGQAGADDKPARDELIRSAHLDFHYSKSDIARATGMHRSTVGKIIQFQR